VSLPTKDEYLDRWSRLHGGYDPRASRLTGAYLAVVYAVARPVAATRIPPDLVTLLGVGFCGLVVWVASLGGRWPILAFALVAVSGLVDSLDGAVAVLTDRVTRWGYVWDSVADRVSDGLYLVALWLLGAEAWVCVAAGSLMLLQEYARARAVAGGMDDIGVVTVWERPTRVITTAMFLLGCGIYPAASEGWARAGSYAWLVLGAVGLAQLLLTVRRRLT
jgi:CDP-diacylglycerol--glycerol-3-phosphate 3-phosphatidyltransferase